MNACLICTLYPFTYQDGIKMKREHGNALSLIFLCGCGAYIYGKERLPQDLHGSFELDHDAGVTDVGHYH